MTEDEKNGLILFYDTETTGKADFKLPFNHQSQPRIVQYASILCDFKGQEVSQVNLTVRPDGFQIPDEASSIHGITTAIAMERGVQLKGVLRVAHDLMASAQLCVCHNSDYDRLVMSREMHPVSIESRDHFCTMKAMTPIVNIPGPYGPKWPKMQEAFQFCFGRQFDDAHDALADVRACKEVFFWMKSQGHLNHLSIWSNEP